MKHWNIKSSENVYSGRSLLVWNDVCETAHNGIIEYCYAEMLPWVLAVAINEQGQIILTEQYRHPLQRVLFEFPAGCVDEGEDPRVAVRREVKEETGYNFVDYQELGVWFEMAGKARCQFTAFVGYIKGPRESQKLDDNEDLDCIFKTVNQIDEMIKSGEIISAPYIAAFYTALRKYPDYFE